MNSEEGRDPPGEIGEGERPSFGRQAAPLEQEEREPLLPVFYGTPYGQDDASPPGTGPGDSDDVLTLECEPQGKYRRITLTLVGAPDTAGLRAKLIHDLMWGRWSRPQEGDDFQGAGVTVPARPPG